MSGIGEASLVLSLISSTITIIEAALVTYEAANDTAGLPKKLRLSAEQLRLVHNALSLAEQNINAKNVTEEVLQSASPILERCKESAASVKKIFEETMPTKNASKAERLRKAVGINLKSNKVKNYMEEIFRGMELLAQNQVFHDTEALMDIKEAIKQLNNIPDVEEHPHFIHSGTGGINANTGEGTQNNYNNSGAGANQYIAENQYFRPEQGDRIARIHRWLGMGLTAERGSQATILEDLLDLRAPGTGEWFLQTADFKKWAAEINKVFWLRGKVGAGKSVTTSTVIEHVQQLPRSDGITVLYYFCQNAYAESNSILLVYRSLLVDLMQKHPETIPDILDDETGQTKEQCTRRLLLNVLQKCFRSLPRVFLIIDALDEFNNGADLADKLISLRKESRLNLFFTSREHFDISRKMRNLKDYELALDSDAVSTDISRYIDYQLNSEIESGHLELAARHPALRLRIQHQLSSKADGMFLFVKYHIFTLQKMMTEKDIENALHDLPETLDDTYAAMFYRLSKDFPRQKDRIRTIFIWLAHSKVPLHVNELAQAIGLDSKHQSSNLDTNAESLLRFSGFLFRLSKGGRTMVLSHESVRQFLLSDMHKTAASGFAATNQDAQLEMLQTCLFLLCNQDLGAGPCHTIRELRSRSERYPLLQYCAEHWIDHLNDIASNVGGDLKKLIIAFFTEERLRSNLLSWQQARKLRLFDGLFSAPYDLPREKHLNPLIYASENHSWPLTKLLLEAGVPFHAESLIGQPWAPLEYTEEAATIVSKQQLDLTSRKLARSLSECDYPEEFQRYWTILLVLADKGADLQCRDLEEGNNSVLESLASNLLTTGEMIDKLVSYNLDVNEGYRYPRHMADYPHGVPFNPPLQLACKTGNVEVASALIRHGADVNFSNCRLGSPLQAAVRSQSTQLIIFLLKSGCDINGCGGELGSPLQAAAASGNEEIVKLLLYYGADANTAGGIFGDALTAAFAHKHNHIISILLMLPSIDPRGHAGNFDEKWLEDFKLTMHHPKRYTKTMTGNLNRTTREFTIKEEKSSDWPKLYFSPISWAIVHEDITAVQDLLKMCRLWWLHLLEPLSINPLNDPVIIKCGIGSSTQRFKHHPLCVAIAENKIGIAHLLASQAGLNAYQTLLCALPQLMALGDVQLLLQLLENVEYRHISGILFGALCRPSPRDMTIAVIQMIQEKEISYPPSQLGLAWTSAIKAGDLVKAQWLLDSGTPFFRDYEGGDIESKYFPASKDHLANVVDFHGLGLFEMVAPQLDVVAHKSQIRTALLYAHGRLETLDLFETLLVFAGNVNNPFYPSQDGFALRHPCGNLLHEVVECSHVGFVDAMIKHGVDVEARCQIGPTALWIALKQGRLDVAEKLVLAGADLNCRDIVGMTPLSWAQKAYRVQEVEYLARLSKQELLQIPTQTEIRSCVESSIKRCARDLRELLEDNCEESNKDNRVDRDGGQCTPATGIVLMWATLAKCLFFGNDLQGCRLAVEQTKSHMKLRLPCDCTSEPKRREIFYVCNCPEPYPFRCAECRERHVSNIDTDNSHRISELRASSSGPSDGLIALDSVHSQTRASWLRELENEWRFKEEWAVKAPHRSSWVLIKAGGALSGAIVALGLSVMIRYYSFGFSLSGGDHSKYPFSG